MKQMESKSEIRSFDERRDIVVPGNGTETVLFCVRQFLEIGQDAINKKGLFTVALSGGSTPNAIFTEMSKPEYVNALDWSKVYFFWSDERNVPPTDSDSNYFNAMQAGLGKLPLPPENIFRMPAENNISEGAQAYEHMIKEKIPALEFDLIMLGMGEDGHTASLFPCTDALHTKDRLVSANYIPQKETWRMTLTYDCIHKGKTICIYVIGGSKSRMVAKALLDTYDPDNLPIQKIGTPTHKALWILDSAASEQLLDAMKKL